MNDRSTLDRKYQRSRELGYIPRNTVYKSPVKPQTTFRNKTIYTPKYRPVKYATEIAQQDVLKVFDSPIKSISQLPFTPSRLQPTKLYKTLHESTPVSRGILRTTKNRRYEGKNRKVPSLSNNKGIFNRLRSFLVKFSLSNHEHDQSDLQMLRKSAKNVLNIEDATETKTNKRVCFENEEQRKSLRHWTTDEPRDFVDEAISLRRQQYESEKLNSQISMLQDQIKHEKEKNERIRNQYQGKIRLLEQSYQAHTEEQNSQILTLQKQANLHISELEKSKLEDLENELFKKHEKFLVKQKEKELELLEEKVRLENLEHDLNLERIKLEKDFAKLKKDRKAILKQELEIGAKSKRLNELDSKTIRLLDNMGHQNLDSDMEAISKIKLNQERYRQERKMLEIEAQSIRSDLESNEHDYVKFFEKLIEISQAILKSGDSGKEYILNDFETLLDSLNTSDMATSLLAKFESIKFKFAEYLTAFCRFQVLYSTQRLQVIGEEYNLDDQREIRPLFARLQESFSKSIYKKRNLLYEMNREISKFHIDLISTSTSNQRCKDIARTFEKRSRILNEMKVINELLVTLSVLLVQLEDIVVVLEYLPDTSLIESILEYNWAQNS